jgi:putative glutamine amidotransferase
MGAVLIGITADWREDRGHLRLSLCRDYVSWLHREGMRCCVLPSVPGAEEGAIEGLDGLLLSGGGDIPPELYGGDPVPQPGEEFSHRDRSAFEFALVWRALSTGLPLLGICLGCQTLNAALGGGIVRHLDDPKNRHRRSSPSKPNPQHRIRPVPGTIVASMEPTRDIRVCSSHHQAVGPLAPGWLTSAYGPDGVVEAIECREHPMALGVQWHPERTPHSQLSHRLAHWLQTQAESRGHSRGSADGVMRSGPRARLFGESLP